ncbi:MAG: MGMT family protein [Ardenticatenaceae bacterium]
MTKQPISFFQRAIEMIKRVPHGKVTTYGQISILISDSVRRARAVGYALAGLSEQEAQEVPWWRVINGQGRISNSRRRGGDRQTLQRQLLEDEGVVFDEADQVDLFRFGWPGP